MKTQDKLTKLIIAGFGGQGVLTMGVILANSAVVEEKNATWLPSYGPEMRGGTANCNVIVAEEEIGSPIITSPDILVVFNLPSMEKFLPRLRKGGILIYNSSLIKKKIERDDIKKIALPLVELTKKIKNPKVGNMIALGSLLKLTGLVSKDSVVESLKKNFKDKKELVEINKKALDLGYEYVKS
ncbi:2-oxoacid:ferredoxin oxidoreductase subunit gamma [Candidatus Woesearchaeota archaeon]|nr:2-oxoacid:ferredoxin oxidoreductase subunit gamma [Candidatus Woesearchaeota archaeon]